MTTNFERHSPTVKVDYTQNRASSTQLRELHERKTQLPCAPKIPTRHQTFLSMLPATETHMTNTFNLQTNCKALIRDSPVSLHDSLSRFPPSLSKTPLLYNIVAIFATHLFFFAVPLAVYRYCVSVTPVDTLWHKCIFSHIDTRLLFSGAGLTNSEEAAVALVRTQAPPLIWRTQTESSQPPPHPPPTLLVSHRQFENKCEKLENYDLNVRKKTRREV